MRKDSILLAKGAGDMVHRVINYLCAATAILLLILDTCAQPGVLSPEIEKLLDQKTEILKTELANDPVILNAVKEANVKNKDIPLPEIKKQDEQWIASKGVDPFIEGFITNDCAVRLVAFQDSYNEYAEIFVTDTRGLIVGETNKTSDYYQADEDWWIKSYQGGQGISFHGEIEYDESAMSESVPIYIPIIEPETKKAIGVIKAIVDITAIKMEL